MSRTLPEDPRRIALWVGECPLRDTMLVSVLCGRLREIYPLARLDLVATRQTREFYREVECVDQVVAFEPVKGFFPSLRRGLDFVGELRLRKYDLIFLVPGGADQVLAAVRAGIPHRLGYFAGLQSLLLTRRIPRLRGVEGQPARFLQLASPWGEPAALAPIEVRVSDYARSRAVLRLAEWGVPARNEIVVLCPADARRPDLAAPAWLPEAVKRLVSTGKRATVLVVGPTADDPVAASFTAAYGRGAVNVAGRVEPDALGALIADARLVVTLDPDLALLADALGVPFTGFAPAVEQPAVSLLRRPEYLQTSDTWVPGEAPAFDQRVFLKLAAQAVRTTPKPAPVKKAAPARKSSAAARPAVKKAKPAAGKKGKPAAKTAARRKPGGR